MQYDALVKSQQERVDAAMTREWDKWNEFGVTKFLSQKQLNDIIKRNPDPKIVGTRWVFTEKVIQGKPDYKAWLVVQGCQEDKGHIRTDASTGSRDAFFMTLSAAAQDGWDYKVFDAQSPYLQRRHRETVAVADASQKSAFWDETRASVCFNWFDLRDQRRWTCVVRAQQESAQCSWVRGVQAGIRPIPLAWTFWT